MKSVPITSNILGSMQLYAVS